MPTKSKWEIAIKEKLENLDEQIEFMEARLTAMKVERASLVSIVNRAEGEEGEGEANG